MEPFAHLFGGLQCLFTAVLTALIPNQTSRGPLTLQPFPGPPRHIQWQTVAEGTAKDRWEGWRRARLLFCS